MWKLMTDRQKTIITDFSQKLKEEGFKVKEINLLSVKKRFFDRDLLQYSVKFLIDDNIEYASSLEIKSYIYFYNYKNSVNTNKFFDICTLVINGHFHSFSSNYCNEKQFTEEISECNFGDACGKIEEQLYKLKKVVLSYPYVHEFLNIYDVKIQEAIIRQLGL